MHLDQHVEPGLGGGGVQLREAHVVERGNDQQHRVGAQRPRLPHLVGVDSEVLAQHRQRARRTRLVEVGVGALEEVDVGQHRQAGRTATRVGGGDPRRVEVGAQQPLARRGALDLGDYRRVAARDTRRERAAKTAHRRGGDGRLGDRRQRPHAGTLGDLLNLAREDPLEDVRDAAGHRLRLGGRQGLGERGELLQPGQRLP